MALERAAHGVERGGGCVAAPRAGDSAAIVDCAAAPSWQLDDTGALRSSDGLCLDVNATGEIVAQACGALGPGGRFFLDDEGHLWSGLVPPPQDGMDHAHLYCVGQAGGQLRAGLCGADFAPSWELARPTTATPRTTATITRTGRAVRIARLSWSCGVFGDRYIENGRRAWILKSNTRSRSISPC